MRTALFTYSPYWPSPFSIWAKHSEERVKIVIEPHIREDDRELSNDEFQVYFKGEGTNPFTVIREELSDFREEE